MHTLRQVQCKKGDGAQIEALGGCWMLLVTLTPKKQMFFGPNMA
jgi:hypothetical protein